MILPVFLGVEYFVDISFFSPRALMGVVKNVFALRASQLLNTSGVDLLLTDLVSTKTTGRCFFFSFLFSSVTIFLACRW